MEQTGRTMKVTGFTLKMIAVISMLIDHTAATIIERMLIGEETVAYGFVADHWEAIYYVYFAMRCIGRLAFPIYCFLIVEGFAHTRNVKKYAFRLFLFALISEVPFDLAVKNSFWDFSYNNVFFTLCIGLIVIALVDAINKRISIRKEDQTIRYPMLFGRCVLDAVIIFAGMLLAEYGLHTDYGAGGVVTIVLLYLLRNNRAVAFSVAVIILAVMCGAVELLAFFSLVPVLLYNGQRGRQSKYFFYAFYPAHLLILSIICMLLGLGI